MLGWPLALAGALLVAAAYSSRRSSPGIAPIGSEGAPSARVLSGPPASHSDCPVEPPMLAITERPSRSVAMRPLIPEPCSAEAPLDTIPHSESTDTIGTTAPFASSPERLPPVDAPIPPDDGPRLEWTGIVVPNAARAAGRDAGAAYPIAASTPGPDPILAGLPSPRPADARPSAPRLSESERRVLREQVERKLTAGFGLAERHAFFSAKREFEQALRVVAEARDAWSPSHSVSPRNESVLSHTDALARAIEAIDEADDFVADSPRSAPRTSIANTIATHRTPILRDRPEAAPSSAEAMRAYYEYARSMLHYAVAGEPLAAHALFGLGRIHQVVPSGTSASGLSGPKATLMYQMAVAVDPGHVQAANEWGVLLARYGQFHEARSVLQATRLDLRSAEVWHNLAVVHERLGEWEWAAAAHQHYQAAEWNRRSGVIAAASQSNGAMSPWVDIDALSAVSREGGPGARGTAAAGAPGAIYSAQGMPPSGSAFRR